MAASARANPAAIPEAPGHQQATRMDNDDNLAFAQDSRN
jgi:hypothetical protein